MEQEGSSRFEQLVDREGGEVTSTCRRRRCTGGGAASTARPVIGWAIRSVSAEEVRPGFDAQDFLVS